MAGESLFSELAKVIEQVGKDKGIDRQIIIDAVTQGMLSAARKKYGTYREIEASYNEETGEIELFEFKDVVEREKFVDEEVEIPLDEAQKLDPQCQVDDSIGIKMETSDLGRIAAQTAKQIITQKVRDAEREIIFNEFEQRRGEIASGIVRRVEKSAIVVDLGRTEAYLPLREQIPGEQFKPGDRIQGYLLEVRQTTRGPQIIMSRSSDQYLMKLFEAEVPEIYEGLIEIMSASREPGQRAKIAVRSKDGNIDPVGACVGMKGTRVQNIVQELRGEKIDIVPWNEDITRFAANALAPAEISRIFLDEENKELEIVVPDQQLSLAIGRRGQNVRLASKLTGWKIDIISETTASARTAQAIGNLMLIPGMTETMAQSLFQYGFGTFQTVAQADLQEIMTIPGYEDETAARKLQQDAQSVLLRYSHEGKPLPTVGGEAGIPSLSGAISQAAQQRVLANEAKAQADLRLRQEMEKLSQGVQESQYQGDSEQEGLKPESQNFQDSPESEGSSKENE